MKPWPAILAELYPLPPSMHDRRCPERPWWREYGDSWTRCAVTDTGTTYTAVNQAVLDRVTGAKGAKSAIEYMREMDAQDPLPHPGVRVGQTWALLNGDLNVFTISEYAADHVEYRRLAPRGYILPGLPESRAIVKPWHCGASWLHENEIHALVGLGAYESVNAYLLADAVCPWLAPWSAP